MPLSLVSKSQLRCCFCYGVLAALLPVLDIVLLSAVCTHRVTSWLFLVSDNNPLSVDRQRTKPFHTYDSSTHMRLMGNVYSKTHHIGVQYKNSVPEQAHASLL